MPKTKHKDTYVPEADKKSTEFAVIETGGKQYKVRVGEVIEIEKLGDDYKVGDTLTFSNVLLVDNGKDTTIGMPYIEEAQVEGELADQGKGKKVDIMTYKPKSRYVRRKGHRQPYMKVRITKIK